jgi:ABC-type Fe3+-siderophore transport system permease subunit
MIANHKKLLYVAAALLALAILPLPYGYYIFLRFAVFAIAAFIVYQLWQAHSEVTLEILVLAGVAILFNPLVFVTLSRGSWFFIDLIAAGGLAYIGSQKRV